MPCSPIRCIQSWFHYGKNYLHSMWQREDNLSFSQQTQSGQESSSGLVVAGPNSTMAQSCEDNSGEVISQ